MKTLVVDAGCVEGAVPKLVDSSRGLSKGVGVTERVEPTV